MALKIITLFSVGTDYKEEPILCGFRDDENGLFLRVPYSPKSNKYFVGCMVPYLLEDINDNTNDEIITVKKDQFMNAEITLHQYEDTKFKLSKEDIESLRELNNYWYHGG